MNQFDTIIIGGGAAGCSASIHLASRNRKVLLLDKGVKEGYLGSLGKVVNFPAFPEAVSGTDIIKRMRRQAERLGAIIKTVEITSISFSENSHKATGGNENFVGYSTILSTGAAARTGYSNGEREFFGRGVSHSIQMDGLMAANKIVAVIGKNKIAAEEALSLSKITDKIYFVIPSNKLEVENQLINQLQRDAKIDMLYSTSLKSIDGNEAVTSITVFTGGQEKKINVAHVFDYTHDYQPSNQFIKDALKIPQNEGIAVDDQLKTQVAGVFACGDMLCNKPQAPVIAAAQGLLAAISTDKYLNSKKQP